MLYNSFLIFAQNTDSVYYYRENGEKEWWYIQEDVFSFRMLNGLTYSNSETDTSIVDSVYQRSNSSRKINVMEFRPESNDTQREIEKNKPRNRPDFECEFLVLSKNKLATKIENKWKTTDDLILVVFRDPGISSNEVAQFMNRNDLMPYHVPSINLPQEGTWTYIFRLKPNKCGQSNTIEKAQEIFKKENALVKICSPNLRVYEPACEVLSYEYSNLYPEANKLWWLENTGEEILNGQVGTADADIDICECWTNGLNGDGIKVGIIDFNGFQYGHEDLQGSFTQGWNAITNTTINTNALTDDVATGTAHKAHGMFVSGLVSANRNDIGIIGSAFNAEIYPVLIDGEIAQTVIGLQKAVEADCDVVNMSFGLNLDHPDVTEETEEILHNEIIQGAAYGRNISNYYYGMVFVASTGNDKKNLIIPNSSSDVYQPGYKQLPAGYDEVIGVGNSNLYDKHEFITTINGTFNNVGGANGGEWYEVVAPGSLMFSTDLTGNLGYTNNNYSSTTYFPLYGTSFSAPLVSGIASLLLQKHPLMTWQELRSFLIDGAEKVHPELYNYSLYPDFPGVSNQMYYGRVSCERSLNLLINYLSVKELTDIPNLIRIIDSEIINLNGNQLNIEIIDIQGKIINQSKILENEKISLSDLNKGMYIVNIYSMDNNYIKSIKIFL